MKQALYWHWQGSVEVHGPVGSVGAIARTAWRAENPRGIVIGTATHRSFWRTAIFDTVDELFDQYNDDPATPGDPPSCAWSPDHLQELRARLESALGDWLDLHGYRRAPAFADIEWHVAFTAAEVARMAQAEWRDEYAQLPGGIGHGQRQPALDGGHV